MLYKAIADSPGAKRARANSKRNKTLGRLDSGIELDLGLSSPRSSFIFHDDFLVVHKGDVFKCIEVPEEKRLIYVERIARDTSLIEEEDGESFDGVFTVDIESKKDEDIVAKGYIPADCVEFDDSRSNSSAELFDDDHSQGCCKWCSNCNCKFVETKKRDAMIKKLTDENRQLKAQLQELQLTNDGLLDSMSWNGEDELLPVALRFESPKSPRLLRSPRPIRPRSRTSRSNTPETEADIFLKILEIPVVEKQEDTEEEEIQLSCTLCSRKIKLTELEIHSKICSSASASKEIIPTIPNMLITNVTQVTHSSCTDQLLKVITKTTLKKIDGHLFEVNRSLDDFIWFRDILQLLCPSRIVPGIQLHGTLNGNFREIQRFLRRLTNHEILKAHDFVKDFLTKKDIAIIRQQHEGKHLRRQNSTPRKPIDNSHDENSLLYRALKYITMLQSNLDNLAAYFREKLDTKLETDGISEKFTALSNGEVNETYLKIAASGLSRITQANNVNKEETHEAALVEELESLCGHVKEAENLIKRIEVKRDNYLYWNDQMKIYEQQNNNKETDSSTKTTTTQKWAEASANCKLAKTSLENICKPLSEELTHFDITKENDLKEILVDFADGNFQYYEKLQSKWYGVRIMLDAEIMPNKRGFDMA